MKGATPSRAQAQLIARLWGKDRCITASIERGGYVEPTVRICIKRGWISPTGVEGEYPNGSRFGLFVVNASGLEALENFLRVSRARTQ